MKITVTEANNYSILDLEGRIDVTGSPQLENEVTRRIDAGKNRLVFDCSGVDYISSSGLRVFLFTQKVLTRSSGKLHVCCMKSEIRDIFEMTGLLGLFSVFETREEALNS
ncbi:MAG: STAS domain-containing protein [Opitutales bacterium]|nr:STAS domain-containing protein [Opitutales bacterium]